MARSSPPVAEGLAARRPLAHPFPFAIPNRSPHAAKGDAMSFAPRIRPLLAGLMLMLTFAAGPLLAETARKQAKPIDPANMDVSVKPGVDFYHYANGKWLLNNPIPADESRWGSFNELQQHNYDVLRGILEDAAKKSDAPKGSAVQLVGDFYASAMDSAGAEAQGAKPLDEEFGRM